LHASKGVVFSIEVAIASLLFMVSIAMLYYSSAGSEDMPFEFQQSMRVAHDMVTSGDISLPDGYSNQSCDWYARYAPLDYEGYHAEVCFK